jgi:hypothetical protein
MNDEEMYKKMEFMQNEDETFGCYIKGHYDIEQFERVSREFLKNECKLKDNEEIEIKEGYYRAVPYCYDKTGMMLYYFSSDKGRGKFPIMEARFD